MFNIAVYPGTFDPLTNGHADIIRRATQLFDKVIVAVAENSTKSPLFNLSQRIEMIQDVFAQYPTVEVKGCLGLITQFTKGLNANIILRGLRSSPDFEYEFPMAEMNRKLEPDIETVFLTATEQHRFISSNLVKEIARAQGDVSAFVPSCVARALKKLSYP